MKTITVNFAKLHSIRILFTSLFVLLIVCSWIFVGWEFIFLIIPIAFFLLWNIRRTWRGLIGKRPALIIDREGIVDNTHWYSLGRVEWEAVDLIKSKQLFLIQNVQVIFKDPSAVIQKEKKFFKKLVQSIHLLTKKTPMLLNSRLLGIPHHELTTLLRNIDFENPDFVDLSEHLIN